MRRALLKNVSLYATTFTKSPLISHSQTLNLIPKFNLPIFHRFFSEDSGSSDQNPNPSLPPAAVDQTSLETTQKKILDLVVDDVNNEEEIKQKVQAKYDELAEKMENNGLEAEKAYEEFKVFEDEIVAEHIKKDEEERLLPESDEVATPVDKMNDDPPGVGPILRWQTRLVLVPGEDAWHPKNRKVKLSVTVKELGLSKYQFRRMREIVGTRYHSGKDELTISSERFEHREENRKDCLRTLLSIIEEAGKADALVDEARTAYVKQRLKANPDFMARLHAKTKQAPAAIPA